MFLLLPEAKIKLKQKTVEAPLSSCCRPQVLTALSTSVSSAAHVGGRGKALLGALGVEELSSTDPEELDKEWRL